MNWQVAEAALFHGGGSSGYCEDEMEKEMAAYAEHLRRRKTEAKVEGEHADDSAAMAAEHRSMRERERQAGLARVEAERKDNQESTSLVGQQFGLPPELSEASRPTPAPSPGPRRPSPALSPLPTPVWWPSPGDPDPRWFGAWRRPGRGEAQLRRLAGTGGRRPALHADVSLLGHAAGAHRG